MVKQESELRSQNSGESRPQPGNRSPWAGLRWWVGYAVCMVCMAWSTTTWAYSGRTGEPNNPYQIATAEDLIALGNEPNDYNDCFILTADIDLSGYVFDRAVIAPDVDDREYGFQGQLFNGYFDGQGHVIRHLSIRGTDYVGLFGVLARGSAIIHLGMEDEDVSGIDYIGGLVGYNGKGNITLSYVVGEVSGFGGVGGLAGVNLGAITRSYSDGVVCGNSAIGGFIGVNGTRDEGGG